MPGYGGYDQDEMVQFTMKSLMRLIEIRDSREQTETLAKQDIETKLSFLGIRYEKADLVDFQKYIDGFFDAQDENEKERYIFKLSFKLTIEVVRKMKPVLKSPEYEEWKLLKNVMLEMEHDIEPCSMVPESFKHKIRSNLIKWCKSLYGDFEAMASDRRRDKEDRFDNAVLHAAGDVVPSYDKIMSNRVTSDKMKNEFEDVEIEDEIDEDDY